MNIDLATFNINTDELFKKLVQTRAEIDKLKASQKTLRDDFNASNKSVTENQKRYDDLNAQLQKLSKGTASYNQTLANRDRAEQELNKSLLEQSSLNESYQASLTETQLAINKLSNQARSYQSVLDTQNRATNESIDLYSRQRAELSLLQKEQRELGVALAQATKSGDVAEIQKLSKAYDDASVKANELATELRGIDTAGGNFTSNIGNYKSALEDFKIALFAGDTQGLKNSFDAITGSIKGMITQSLAFIATPIGATITALVGIGAAAKAVFDFNDGIKESNTLLKGLGVASGEISKVRTELEATSETYGKSFEEIAKTANSLAKSYGLSISEANDIIAKGLAQGGASNQDFLNQISEYDIQFKNLGYSAEEAIALINKGFEEGVYNDKLADALKESDLALKERTKATEDAIVNAFGSEFSSKLFKGLESGSISTKEALEQLSAEATKLGLNTQQAQQLTADLFKGAGEDAGGALKIFELVNETQVKGLSETEQAYEDLREANERYNKVQAGLFEIENFGSVWAGIKAEALNFFLDAIEGVNSLMAVIKPLTDFIKTVLGFAWVVVKDYFVQTKNAIVSGLKFLSDKIYEISILPQRISNAFVNMKNIIITSIQAIANFIKPVLTSLGVDVDNLNKKLNGLKGKTVEIKKQNKTVETLESKGSGAVEKVKADKEAELDRIEAEKLKKLKAEQDKKNADANNKRLAEAQKAKEDAQKKLDDAIKAELASAQKLADEKVKLANVELNAYIEKNKSILDNEKYLTSELLKQEQERLKNIENAKLAQEKLEFDNSNKILNDKIAKIEKDKTLNQTQLNELATLKLQQKELEIQYNSDVTKIKDETQKGITASETRYSNERIEAEKMRKAIQFQTELLDLEAKGATEQEIKAVQLDQQTQLELDKLIEKQDTLFQAKIAKDQEQRDIQAEIDLVQDELQAELQLAKDENERIRIQTQLDAIKQIEIGYANDSLKIENAVNQNKIKGRTQLLTGLAQLFGAESEMGKALAIANIAQEKAFAISSIVSKTSAANAAAVLASPLTAGQPWVGINTAKAGIDIGILVAQGAASIAQITGSKFAPNLGGLATTLQGVQTLNGFADGGLINGGVSISRANGDNRLITAKDGEVILNESQQRALGGADIFRAIGVPGFATGGLVGTSNLPSIQNQINNGFNSELLAETIREAVLEGALVGTATGSQRGISDLNDNISVRAGANF